MVIFGRAYQDARMRAAAAGRHSPQPDTAFTVSGAGPRSSSWRDCWPRTWVGQRRGVSQMSCSLPGQLDLEFGAVVLDLELHLQIDVIGDVRNKPHVLLLDHDIIA